MTPLIPHFDLLATAPGGVARLRELILTLAVQGKLVPQDPADEPASVLLQRIRAEKDRLIAAGKIKRDKSQPFSDEETPFTLPESWKWSTVENLCALVTDGEHATPQRCDDRNSIPLVTAKNVRSEYMDYTDTDFVPREVAEKCWTRCKPEAGDILMVSVGATLGRLCVLSEARDMVLVRSVTVLRPIQVGINSNYLALHLMAPASQSEIWGSVKQSAQPCLYLAKSAALKIALPPLAEQSRIVTRVEELMRLCDALEQQRQLETAQHAQLLNTLLGTLTDCTSPDELAANWQRVSDHFDLLLDRPEAVDALEQTILQLAVRGLLVPQDPREEPAARTLDRIKIARKSKRKIVTPDAEAITEAEFKLPHGWTWASIDAVSSDSETAITDGPFGANLKTAHYVDNSGFRVIRLQNIGNGKFREEHRAYIDEERFNNLIKHRIYPGDLVVAGLVDEGIRCCIVPSDLGPAIVKADCYRFSVHEHLSAEFLCIYLSSETAHKFAAIHHHGLTLTRIGLGNFRSIPVAVPPADEQTRIVARVTQLRDLCTTLRQRLAAGQTTQRHLAEALVEV